MKKTGTKDGGDQAGPETAKPKTWDATMGIKRTKKYASGSLGAVLGLYRQSPEYKTLRQTSKRTYEQAFDRLYAMGMLDLAGLRRRHILRIRDDLSDTPAAANAVLTALSVLCRFAVDREIIDVNPSLKIPRLKLGEWRRWTDDELDRFYAETYEALRRVLVVGLFSGQRRSDMCKMLWSDIDGGAVRVVQQKTGAKLWVPMHPTLAAHVAEWRKDAATVTVLAHSDRRPWSPNVLSRAFANETDRLEMDGCTIHGLRKTAAAKLAEAGCSTHQIASITGHASLSEIERYTREADQAHMAEAAIGKLIVTLPKMVCNPLKRKG